MSGIAFFTSLASLRGRAECTSGWTYNSDPRAGTFLGFCYQYSSSARALMRVRGGWRWEGHHACVCPCSCLVVVFSRRRVRGRGRARSPRLHRGRGAQQLCYGPLHVATVPHWAEVQRGDAVMGGQHALYVRDREWCSAQRFCVTPPPRVALMALCRAQIHKLGDPAYKSPIHIREFGGVLAGYHSWPVRALRVHDDRQLPARHVPLVRQHMRNLQQGDLYGRI